MIQRNKPPLRVVLLHACFWSIFIILELAYLRRLNGGLEPAVNYLVYYGLNVGLFYGQLWLMHLGFKKPGTHLLKRVSLFALLLTVYLGLKYEIHDILVALHIYTTRPIVHLTSFLTGALFRAWYFIFLAAFYWAAGHLAAYSRRAKDAEQAQRLAEAVAERQLAEARVAYLQQQLNPHLLFNSLNFIYTSVYKHSEEGARAVELLSEIMRYSLAGADTDGKTSLSDELAQVMNLVEINASRFSEPLQLQARVDGIEEGDHRILPLILLTLTENLFKHGHVLDRAHPAKLHIHTAAGRLTFMTRNRKKVKTGYDPIGGTGLVNARTRLDYAYGPTYTLEVTETTEIFELTLTLPV
jgi:two-component system LytT family sensor kinase